MDKFRLAAKAFVLKESRILLLQRSSSDVQKPGIWEIPGGRLELGEDPREGLKRELMEETGIKVQILNPFNVRHFKRDDGQTITLIIFLCKFLEGDVRISKEHEAFEWIELKNLKEKINDFFYEEVDIFNKLELEKSLD